MFTYKKLHFVFVMTLALGTRAMAQFPAMVDGPAFDGREGFTVFGQDSAPLEFGSTVAGVGDVNADGIDDVACAGFGWEATYGTTYVFFGGADVAGDGTWSTSDLNGRNGFRVPGIYLGGYAGRVSSAGDFNNDGIGDFLVGAQWASPSGIVYAGQGYVIYGAPGLGSGGSFNLASLNGSNGFMISGSNPFGELGDGIANLGDADGDGVSDIAVSNPGADPGGRSNAGQVYVLFGGRGIAELGGVTLPNDLTPEFGIAVNGIAAGDAAGLRVGAPGDFNGDGFDDLLITAFFAEPEPGAQGQVYLVYGGPGLVDQPAFELSDLDGTNGFIINGPPAPGPYGTIRTGLHIAGVGDVNDDGFDDIGITGDSLILGEGDYVAVVFGGPAVAPDGVFCLEDLNGENGFVVIRGSALGSFSRSGLAGDVNHDGIDDLFAQVNTAHIIFGRPGLGSSGVIRVIDLDGREGFWFRTVGGAQDLSSAGDLNHDGLPDAAVAEAYYHDGAQPGAMQVVFGRRMGDGDLDADVDFLDFGAFQRCFRSEAMNMNPDGKPDVPDECHPFDFDKDNDVDLFDYAVFQKVFGSPP